MTNRVPVRVPTGETYTARLGGWTGTGYRYATIKVRRGGDQFTVSGRVTTRHGYDGRTLPFEVKATGLNADIVLTDDSYVSTI